MMGWRCVGGNTPARKNGRGALCSIAVGFYWLYSIFFLVFDMLIQGRNSGFVVHYRLYNSPDGYGQSIQSSHLKTTPIL